MAANVFSKIYGAGFDVPTSEEITTGNASARLRHPRTVAANADSEPVREPRERRPTRAAGPRRERR